MVSRWAWVVAILLGGAGVSYPLLWPTRTSGLVGGIIAGGVLAVALVRLRRATPGGRL